MISKKTFTIFMVILFILVLTISFIYLCIPTKFVLEVPYLSQEGILPTGCEIVSSTMLLHYYGYSLSCYDLIDHYLDYKPLQKRNGNLYGPSPNDFFIGDPKREDGYGCYAPVIVKALNKICAGKMTAKNTTGTPLDDLITTYVKEGNPVLVWATINLKDTRDGTSWYVDNSNEYFTWLAGEHCMVLVGYDSGNYYFNDPYENNGVKAYPKSTVRTRYEQMGKQSVVLLPN